MALVSANANPQGLKPPIYAALDGTTLKSGLTRRY